MAATCLVLRCYFRTADRMAMPLPLRLFIFQVLARIVRFKTSNNTCNGKGTLNIAYTASHFSSACASAPRKAPSDRLPKTSTRACHDGLIVQHLSKIANILEDKMKSEKESEEWQEAAIIIDKFFFWLFFVVTVAGTMAVFLQAPTPQY